MGLLSAPLCSRHLYHEAAGLLLLFTSVKTDYRSLRSQGHVL